MFRIGCLHIRRREIEEELNRARINAEEEMKRSRRNDEEINYDENVNAEKEQVPERKISDGQVSGLYSEVEEILPDWI